MQKQEESMTKLAVIANDINYIKADVKEIKTRLEGDYVKKEEFDPVKKVVYGMVTLVLVAVVGAILTLVIND